MKQHNKHKLNCVTNKKKFILLQVVLLPSCRIDLDSQLSFVYSATIRILHYACTSSSCTWEMKERNAVQQQQNKFPLLIKVYLNLKVQVQLNNIKTGHVFSHFYLHSNVSQRQCREKEAICAQKIGFWLGSCCSSIWKLHLYLAESVQSKKEKRKERKEKVCLSEFQKRVKDQLRLSVDPCGYVTIWE